MLRQRFFLFEYLFAIFFFLQALFPNQFPLLIIVLGFGLLTFNKYQLEGFRVVYGLIVIVQILIIPFETLYIRLPLTIVTLTAIFYFPVYKYPNPTGKYRVGYKMQKVNGPKGPTSMGVYYPTSEKGKDVKYTPTHEAWKRFADVLRFYAEIEKKKQLPDSAFKFALGFLEHCYLGVNLDATIEKPENSTQGFPVVIFSHGLSANIHVYSLQLKEWASNGFIVFSVDHDEEIYLKYSDFPNHDDYLKARNVQLDTRKKTVKKVIDLVHDPAYIQNLFGQNVQLNLNKLFLAGHSFGAATGAELATEDDRVTGGLVLLDPYYECCDFEVLYKPIQKPILTVRSEAFNKVPKLRDPVIKHGEINNKGYGGVLSGMFRGTMHNSQTDLIILMPREMIMFNEIKAMYEIEDHVLSQTMFTKIFLEVAMKHEDSKKSDIKREVLENFRAKLKELEIGYSFIVDESV